jgi:site-specific DNA-methyltransferase (adenine-specific)
MCDRRIGPYPCCSIVQGDCLELMKSLPDGCVDAVITDIPYNCSQRSNGLRELDYGDWDWGFQLVPFVTAIIRIPRGSIYVWCGDTQFSPLIDAFRADGLLDRPCAWVKRNPTVINGDKLWLPGLELCAFGKRPRSTFHANCEVPVWWLSPDPERYHPNQKPLEMIAKQIQASTNETDSVFDPFAGSGTTLVAAKKLGRHFLGFEISPEYCEIARKRLEAIDAQPSLFAPKPEQLTLGGE